MKKAIFIFMLLILIGTMISAQSVTLTAPNGGETWNLGSNQAVTWTFTGIAESTLVKLVLFKDRVDADHKIGNIVENISIGRGGSGSYSWKAGDYEGGTAALGGGYYIRIITMDGAWKDESNNPFTLSIGIIATAEPFVPTNWIRVATPLAPLTMSHSFRIGWNFAGVTRDVNIYLHGNAPLGRDRTYTIATGVNRGGSGGLGHYDWMVGRLSDLESTMLAGDYQIEVSETGTGVKGMTRTFSIVSPTIQVFEPRANETLRRDLYKEIRWRAEDLRGRVHLEAWYHQSAGGGRTVLYTRLFADIRNSGSQYWDVFPPPDRGHSEANPPPTGGNTGWFIRLVSAECPGLHADSRMFHIE